MTPLQNICIALLRRELDLSRVLYMSAAGAAAGVLAAVLSAPFSAEQSGAVMLLVRFDRTAAGIVAIACVFQAIARFGSDTRRDWMVQVTAAGQPGHTYPLAVVLSLSAAGMILYLAVAAAFSASLLLAGGGADGLPRVCYSIPAAILVFAAASAFGCASASLFSAKGAGATAGFVLFVPWLLLWMSLVNQDERLPAWLLLWSWRAAPPTALPVSSSDVATVLLHIAATLSICFLRADRVVGRVL